MNSPNLNEVWKRNGTKELHVVKKVSNGVVHTYIVSKPDVIYHTDQDYWDMIYSKVQ